MLVLGDEAGEIFLDEYGEYCMEEKVFEDVYFPLTGLIDAYSAEVLPSWADEFIDILYSGELKRRVKLL